MTLHNVHKASADLSHDDPAACYVEFRYREVVEAARGGCASCYIVKGVVVTVAAQRGQKPLPEEDWDTLLIALIFCTGHVLKVSVSWTPADYEDICVDNDNETAPDVAIFYCEIYVLAGESPNMQPRRSWGRTVFYTDGNATTGQTSPWPTIGSNLSRVDPIAGTRTVAAGTARHVAPSIILPEGLALLRGWLRRCMDEHPGCRSTQSTPQSFLPKRLLSIGSDHQSPIRLQISSGMIPNQDTTYAALSHCWGKKAQLCTTVSTMNDRQQDIPYHKLSKTFRDAVIIARLLGIEYLWIDSLCIVQDDVHDWETQAAAMGDIYNHAHVVISAASATDGDGGCLFEHPSFVSLTGPSTSDDQQHEIFAREECRSHPPFGLFDESITGTLGKAVVDKASRDVPTFGRAWCFQERLLARRMLHFMKSEVIFECLESISCECGALTEYKDDPLLRPRQLLNGYGVDKNSVPPQLSTAETSGLSLSQLWRGLLETYSYKNMTYQSDLLPAMSGFAGIWARTVTGDVKTGSLGRGYLAGMWASDIYGSLMWRRCVPNTVSRADAEYTAPSWSWASSLGAVEFSHPDQELDAYKGQSFSTRYYATIDLDKSCCLPSGANPFGSVKAGWLHITGPVIRVKLSDYLTSIRDTDGELGKSMMSVQAINNPKADGRAMFRPDHERGWQAHQNVVMFCLFYCVESSTKWRRALLLGPVEAARAKHVRQYLPGHAAAEPIVERLAFLPFCEWEEDAFVGGEASETMSFVVI